MSRNPAYLIFTVFVGILSITCSSDPECDDQGWRIKHSNCWGQCVEVKRNSDGDYILSADQIKQSCGSNRKGANPTNDQKANEPGCTWLFGRRKQLRAYCKQVIETRNEDNEPYQVEYIPLGTIPNGVQGDDTISCQNLVCAYPRRRITGQYCLQPNSKNEESVNSCPQCPPGTRDKAVIGCDFGTHKSQTAVRVCVVTAEWIQFESNQWHVHFTSAQFRTVGRAKPMDYQYHIFSEDAKKWKEVTLAPINDIHNNNNKKKKNNKNNNKQGFTINGISFDKQPVSKTKKARQSLENLLRRYYGDELEIDEVHVHPKK